MSIEQIAIDYIRTRRAKLEARDRRAQCRPRCEGVDVSGEYGYVHEEGAPCYYNTDDSDAWCAACKESEMYHKEFRRLSSKAAGLLRRLENAVNKGSRDGS